ncbi:MAG TPA: DNA polymerase III subunit delta [Candidatus Moranbacteria bacterium]|nr:DNA polymerase III subunit delta [Candidatus Moranbacteria bacterium]HBU25720.1 DNA polymerase III subunit delta [Candidatus Moranbacteria bacterium]
MLRIMIIFLYGEDGFRSNRKLAEIKNKFTEKYKEGGTLFVFDFVEPGAKISDLIIKLSSGGLFSNKKLAIVKNILQNKTAAQDLELLDFLKKADKGEIKDLTLVFWEKERIDKKLKLAKFLLEKTKKQEFGLLDGSKLTNWIIGEIRAIGEDKVSISPKVTEKLSIFVGNNLSLLSKEIEKLVGYRSKGEISEEDINLLVKSKIDTDIFKTIDSLARQDKKTAAGLLHNHLSAGEDPFYLLSMYFYQFRNLLKVKALAEKNVSEREIAQKLKLHPFVARKSLEQGRNFSLDQLKKLYKDLCEIDFGAKTGKIEIELALDKFIASV